MKASKDAEIEAKAEVILSLYLIGAYENALHNFCRDSNGDNNFISSQKLCGLRHGGQR